MFTHQPFLFFEQGFTSLLYCQSSKLIEKSSKIDDHQQIFPELEADSSEIKYHPWKIYYSKNIQIKPTNRNAQFPSSQRVFTGLGDDDIECSPCLSVFENQCIFCFIGGKFDGIAVTEYSLYKSAWEIQSFDNLFLGMPLPQIFRKLKRSGFENHFYRVTSDKSLSKINLIVLKTNKQINFQPPLLVILRLTYLFDNQHSLLVTGKDENDNMQTYLYEIPSFAYLGELIVDNESVYKSSVCGDLAAYAKQTGDFEDREIFLSSNFSWKI